MPDYTADARARQAEIERRRRMRGDARQEQMNMRAGVANTAYLSRMSQRAQASGVPRETASAMAYGETPRQYADAQQNYMDRAAARDIGYISARTPEAVARMDADTRQYISRNQLRGVDLESSRGLEGVKYASDADYMSSAQRAAAMTAIESDRMQRMDRRWAYETDQRERLARMQNDAKIFEGAYKPQPMYGEFDDEGNQPLIGYMMYDQQSGGFVPNPFPAFDQKKR